MFQLTILESVHPDYMTFSLHDLTGDSVKHLLWSAGDELAVLKPSVASDPSLAERLRLGDGPHLHQHEIFVGAAGNVSRTADAMRVRE